jgi:beta-lactamase regulating signal transducer with metallopeptidase domain
MAGALLAAALLQRHRPLAASSVFAAATGGLLALPVLAAFLPGVPVPLGPAVDLRAVERAGWESTAVPNPPANSVRDPDPGSEIGALEDADQRLANGSTSPPAATGTLAAPGQHGETASTRGVPTLIHPTTAVQTRSTAWIGLLLLSIYGLGMLCFVASLATGLCAVSRLRRNATPVSGNWADRLADWGPRVGASRPVELLSSEEIDIPLTVGWWKPVILFPAPLLTAAQRDRDAVLLHELAHIRRRDYLTLLALQIVQALYWCHPLAWLLGRSARQLRERACDDLCIHWMGARETYRDVLLSIAGRTICRPRIALGVAMVQPSRLSQRIAAIDRSVGSATCVPRMGTRLTVFGSVVAVTALAALVQIVPREAIAKPNRESEQSVAQKADPLTADAELPLAVEALPIAGQALPTNLPALDPSQLQQWSAARRHPSAQELLGAIDKAKRELLKLQQPDGSWSGGGSGDTHTVGVSSLALLALFNTGMSADDPAVQRGLVWLRRQEPTTTYEISLMIQALAAANDGRRDLPTVARLVRDLEQMQVRQGPNTGSWSYNKGNMGGGDRSNGQFAVLGLREAQEMGVPVSLNTWQLAHAHWLTCQNPNGAWSYSGGAQPAGGTGSMTVAGITSLVIARDALRAHELKLNPDGTPACAGDAQVDQALQHASRWLGMNFAVTMNPGDGRWVLYYLCGLARAGRFGGQRQFTSDRGQKHNWYREGAEYLTRTQNPTTGTWQERDQNTIVGTSFALLFLSKGLAPVLINKLQHGPRDAAGATTGNDWNRHAADVAHLTQLLGNRPKWPRQLTWQTVDLAQAAVADLLEAPILFISGSESPQFTPEDVALLKDYIARGGCIFADSCGRSAEFDKGFRDFVGRVYPPAQARLKLLAADHSVFRSEFNLIDEQGEKPLTELWGVEVEGRTSIIYSSHGLSCLWDNWSPIEIPGRPPELAAKVENGARAGANVVAYFVKQAASAQADQRK